MDPLDHRCVSKSWLMWPEPDMLAALEASTAAATAFSMGAYAWQMGKGRLLVQR